MEKRLVVAADTVKVVEKANQASPVEVRELRLHVIPRWNTLRLAGHYQAVPIMIVKQRCAGSWALPQK